MTSNELKNECDAFTKKGNRCKRYAMPDSIYCWQHQDYDLNKIPLPEFPNDILQNLINPYLEYEKEVPLVEQTLEKKLEKKHHIYIKEMKDEKTGKLTKKTYLDTDLRKIEVFNSEGVKEAENNFENGKFQGKQYIRYEDGNIAEEHNYENDEKEGKQYDYDGNGILRWEENYKNNLKDGSQYYYYANGKLRLSNNYINGRQDGEYKMYDEDGKLIEIREFENGKLVNIIK